MSPITMITPDNGAIFTSTVVISGVFIVLGVLALLILIFYAFGAIVSSAEKIKSKSKNSSAEAMPPAPVMPVKAPPVKPAPVVEEGISGEVVAAIAAAVAACEGGNAVVTSVRTLKTKNVGARNPWANAAVLDNTRPF